MIGENIKKAREAKGLSLRDLEATIRAADRIDGLNYSAIQRIESGQRKVASHELAELAEVLDTTPGVLLGRSGRSASLALAARVSEDLTADVLVGAKQRTVEILETADLLAQIVGPLKPREVPSFPAVPKSRSGGKKLAALVRQKLDLGSAPIADLTAVVENSFGAHVVHEPLQEGTHGFCVVGDGVAVIIVNSNDVFGKQRFSLAHELCHLVVGDLDLFELVQDAGATTGAEGRADDFAANFLAPDEAVRQAAGGGVVDPLGAVRISHFFGISLQSALIRLKSLSLISDECAAEAENVGPARLSMLAGLTDDYKEAKNKRGRLAPPARLTEQAFAAYNNGQIGIGLVASVLGERKFDRVRESLEKRTPEQGTPFGDRSDLA